MDIITLLTQEFFPRFLSGLQFETTRYIMGTISTFVVIWLLLSRFIKHRKIRARSPKATQFWMEIKNSIRTIFIFVLLDVVLFDSNMMGLFKLYENPGDYGMLYYWLSIPLMLVLHDTYFYWTHRMMHHPKLYKAFHLTHHRSHNPTPFTAYSFAPGEAFVEYLFVPVALMLVPMHHSAFFIVMTIMIFKNALGHCGYEVFPVSWAKIPVLGWLTTVTHHDMHHEKASGNYALYFTWWDRWMATEHHNYHERLETLGDHALPKTRVPVKEIIAAE